CTTRERAHFEKGIGLIQCHAQRTRCYQTWLLATSLWEKAFYNTVCQTGPGTMRLVAATSDLFLRSRIAELAKQTGADPYFGTHPDELRRLVAENRPELVILDLSSTDYDPFSVARELKMKLPVRLVGLCPHVKAEPKKRAHER